MLKATKRKEIKQVPNQTIIGVDPDSEAHGVAVYQGGKLVNLQALGLMDLLELVDCFKGCVVSIENVMANQFVYTRNQHSNNTLQSKIAMYIGRCQQSQVEIMRGLDYHEIPYILHKPTKNNWAKDKALFEKVTGWAGRSNEDTRSAAYFGYLAL